MLNKFRDGVRIGFRDRQVGLRTDTNGFSTGAIVGVLVGGMISILVGYILIPVVANQEYIASKNTSTTGIAGATGLLPLGPLLFILTVIVVPVVLVLFLLKMTE